MKDFLTEHKNRLWWAIMLLIGFLYPAFYLLPGLAQLGGRWAELGRDNGRLILGGFWVGWLMLTVVNWQFSQQKFHTAVKLRKLILNWNLLAVLLCIAVLVGGTVLAYKRHLDLRTGLFDFALEHQVVWNTAQGRPFAASVEVSNYLGDHFSLITLPVSLIYRVFPGELTLFVLQAGAVAVAAFGIFLLAKKILESAKWAFLILSVFLLYWGMLA